MNTKRSIALVSACAAAGLLVFSLALQKPRALERTGLGIYDALHSLFPAPEARHVALVLIDTSSVDALAREQQVYFPFPRAIYGELIRVAKSFGARAMGLDIVFSEPSARGPSDDAAFASSIESAGFPVVVAAGKDAPEPAGTLKNTRGLSWGSVDLDSSVDGIFRRIPVEDSGFAAKLSQAPHSGWIHFSRPDQFAQVSFYNVLQSQFDAALRSKLEPLLKDRIWVVAYAAPGLLDLKPTPLDAQSPGAFLEAGLLENRLAGRGGIEPVGPLGCTAILLGLLAAWILGLRIFSPRRPASLLVLAGGVALLLPAAVSLGAWVIPRAPAWVDPVPLMLGLIAATGLHFYYKVRRDWRDRIQFAKAIQSAMSPEMLSLIERGEVEVRRFGEKREICILFADLAGFTTLSEQLSPEQLVHLMNDYLDGAVDLVLSRQGYVDKFIGDAVMALWGAPVSGRTDVDLALEAALGFEEVTRHCRQKWKQELGMDFPVYTRVGLHLGQAVVGNLGAKSRFNYTALGDSVNLASRLEGVGKFYHQRVSVSGELMDRASPDMKARFVCVDVVTVKGKDLPTRIYSSRAGISDPAVRAYTRAFEAYQREDWDLAIRELSHAELAEHFEGPHRLGAAAVLRERCSGLKMGKGRERFNQGVWALDEK